MVKHLSTIRNKFYFNYDNRTASRIMRILNLFTYYLYFGYLEYNCFLEKTNAFLKRLIYISIRVPHIRRYYFSTLFQFNISRYTDSIRDIPKKYTTKDDICS